MEKSNKRKAISKKLRFEVFKRDSFTCQYCLARPPKVPLEIDHLLPVSKRGTNDIDNLITACFDCNRGKGANELSSFPETILQKSEGKKLALIQYKEFQKIIREQKKQMEIDIDYIEAIYSSIFNDYVFSNKFRISVKVFIEKLGVEDVERAMETSCNRIYNESKALKYFCGICWNNIKEL